MDPTIIGGLFAIVAALLGGLFLIYSSRKSDRRKAGEELIAEFATVETAFSRIDNVHAINPTLKEAEPRLEEKVLIFKRHLHFSLVQESFLDAWAKYQGEGDECGYYQYVPHISSWRDENDALITKEYTSEYCKESFKHNVDNLLKFAKLS